MVKYGVMSSNGVDSTKYSKLCRKLIILSRVSYFIIYNILKQQHEWRAREVIDGKHDSLVVKDKMPTITATHFGSLSDSKRLNKICDFEHLYRNHICYDSFDLDASLGS